VGAVRCAALPSRRVLCPQLRRASSPRMLPPPHPPAGHFAEARAVFPELLRELPVVSGKALFWLQWARIEEDADTGAAESGRLRAMAILERAAEECR